MPEEESKLTKKLEEATKFTEEELKKIKEIQDEYYRTQNQFGQLSVSEIRLNEQLEGLEKLRDETTIAFKNIQEEERKFLDEITKKYGEGSLNPETGEFTRNN
tara:strand:- start:211 stop:519 length:309 start_codon:yes stop_codon:yes gene_type:complete